MKTFYKYILLLFCNLAGFSVFAQDFSITGYVKDSASSEAIVGATIYEATTNTAVISNEYGFFNMRLKPGTYTLECSSLGAKTQTQDIKVSGNTRIIFRLPSESYSIDSVVVHARQHTSDVVTKRLTAKQIELTPSTFGVPDVIKVVQTMPGIKTIGDGTTGMYVRGGNRDQNMIRIDEANIYNVSHMYGYVSSFNPDMLNEVQFYNSYFSPEYGGRISSVLDAQMKEGNLNSFSGSALMSVMTANATVEGPIKKDVASFFVAGRRSILDIIRKYGDFGINVPTFYDVNAKINCKINDRNRIFISSYISSDKQKYPPLFENDALNASGTARWISELRPKLFLTTSVVASKYSNETELQDSINRTWMVGLNECTAKSKLNWYISNNQKVLVGLQSSVFHLTPGNTGNATTSISDMQLFEPSLFANHTISVNNWTFMYGLRITQYHNFGDATWYTIDNGLTIAENKESSGIWNSYTCIEPRIHIAKKIKDSEFSASFTRTSQSMQALSNTKLNYSLLETWFCSSPNLKPMEAENVSIGYTLKKKNIGLLAEAYYRNIQNQIDYIDNANLRANPYVESQVKAGKTHAYGFEISVNGEMKRTQFSASYSFARVMYDIPEILDEPYRAPYDMPHDIKLQVTQRIKERWSFSALWVFASGRPGTFAYGYYKYDGRKIPLYNKRNSDTYPVYHRLDLALHY
ncbi:MAG: TonB-dependent receptor, partial [Bacteroidales bacterium]|nr:TonB-dependent receptor [Bacteroidales bacterium]